MTPPAPQTTSQKIVEACSKPSVGGILSCLFLTVLCAAFGMYGLEKKQNGKDSNFAFVVYLFALCYCLSTLSSIYNFFTVKCKEN